MRELRIAERDEPLVGGLAVGELVDVVEEALVPPVVDVASVREVFGTPVVLDPVALDDDVFVTGRVR